MGEGVDALFFFSTERWRQGLREYEVRDEHVRVRGSWRAVARDEREFDQLARSCSADDFTRRHGTGVRRANSKEAES